MLEHDTECRTQHMQVNEDINDLDGCDCPLIEHIRLQEEKDFAAQLWPILQPLVSWIASVNMITLDNAADDGNTGRRN